jgi:hypothetical protein
LIELAMKYACPLYLELKERVARRKVNAVALSGVPARDNQPTRVRIPLNLADEPGYLVYAVSLRVVAAERAP